MNQSPNFKNTIKQDIAIRLMASAATYIMLYGGSRSGKSAIIIKAIIIRACKSKSRHLIVREKFNHVKTSIWLDTLPKVLRLAFPDLVYRENKSDYYMTLPNGSEIWIGGLDSKERTEKILGKEYSTIFFNECSQLTYASVSMALTRLAEKSELVKKVYFDQNPPSKKHWSYWMFVKHINPEGEEELDTKDYVSMVMNPMDNIENIDSNYITGVLDKLPEKDKKRFRDGEFTDDDDGAVYYSFDRSIHCQHVPDLPGTVFIGQDFNVDPMASVLAKYSNGKIYVFDEIFQRNSDTYKLAREVKSKNLDFVQFIPDSTGKNRKTSGKSDFQILRDEFGSNAIMPTRNPFITDRTNNINRLLEQGKLIIDPKCKKLINDLEKVSWKGNELDQKTDPQLTHISDALGYLCWKLSPIGINSKGVTITKR